jgi:hypothetical protein
MVNDLIESALEGMKLVAVAGVGSFLVGMGYLVTLEGASLMHGIGRKIKSQEELEKVVDEEAPKLGLDPTKISAKYGAEFDGARINDQGGYDLCLGENWFSTRATVRHELRHIQKDCGNEEAPFLFNGNLMPLMHYFFVAEPRASLYGLLKIKT